MNPWSTFAAILFGSAMTLAPKAALADHRDWPVNGRVINEGDAPVLVWDGEHGLYYINGHSESDRFKDDVDHIRDSHGQWWKIGIFNATVTSDGEVTGWGLCRVSNYGVDCGH